MPHPHAYSVPGYIVLSIASDDDDQPVRAMKDVLLEVAESVMWIDGIVEAQEARMNTLGHYFTVGESYGV